MWNPRAVGIALGGAALAAASVAYAHSCYEPFYAPPELQLQSFTVDGVEETDLTKYQNGDYFLKPTQLFPYDGGVVITHEGWVDRYVFK